MPPFYTDAASKPKIALDGVRVRAAYGADAKLVESFVR